MMDGVKLAKDRPRNESYRYKGFEIFIRFNWVDELDFPKSFEITLHDSNPQNYERTERIQNDWTNFEDSLAQGKRIAEGWADQVELERSGP